MVACRDQGTTYPELAAYIGISMSEVHGALKRAEAARLPFFDKKRPRILVPALAAAPLNAHIAPSADPPPAC